MKPSVVRSIVACLLVLIVAVGVAPSSMAESEGASSLGDVTGGMAEIERLVRESEYHVTWQDDTELPDLSAAWQAPNRAHNLRFYFTDGGLRVVDRTALGSPELLRLRVVDSISESPVGEDAVSADGNQLEIRRPGLSETFVNDEGGLRHLLTVNHRPADGGPLVLEMEVSAAKVDVSDRSVEIRSASGRRLVYSHDLAMDALGTPLELTMSSAGNRIRLTFGRSDDVFPITVENLLTGTANTVLEGNQTDYFLGHPIGASGDFNGDGYVDVAAAGPYWVGGQPGLGAVLIFHGGPTGIPSNGTGPIEDAASAMIESDLATDYWPMELTSVGDINGDGFDDLVAGHKYWDPAFPPATSRDRGGLWVFHGSASGITASHASEAEGYVVSNIDGSLFGGTIRGAGDVNGDGYADLIVGAHYWDDSGSQPHEGAAFVFHGSENGITASTIDNADTVLEGNQTGVQAGSRLGGVGDLNGDGFDDIMVGMLFYSGPEVYEGAVAILHGTAQGIDDNPNEPLAAAADALIQGNQAGLAFSGPAAASTDVNGDGYADLVVSAPTWTNTSISGEGALLVFHGGPTGIDSNGATPAVDAADTVIEGNPVPTLYSMQLGIQLIAAGDVNGDGYGDVVATSNFFSNPEVGEGGAFVFLGREGGIPSSRVLPVQEVADFVIEGNIVDFHLGQDGPTAGDVNGDGYSDLALVASNFTSPEDREGAVFIYHGGAEGLAQVADGRYDAHQDGSHLGYTTASAGDINGDGFVDLVTGVPWYDIGGQLVGRVHVFHGSPGPFLTTPDWTIEGGPAGDRIGLWQASAGDVNGDGYGDLAIGLLNFTNGQSSEGRVVVYYGSASGLSSEVDWSFESDHAGAEFGYRVASAGDVNGDGYGDLVVGAPGYADGESLEGRAYVFFGSPDGLSELPEWTFESDVADAGLGSAVADAGDVNGDGYGDIIVGAPGYSSGQNAEGAAYGFWGSPGGLPGVPNWFIETNRESSYYGRPVAGVGDVNGDGYGDVIVGAPNDSNPEIGEGRAYIYHGSSSGLSTAADRVLERNQASSSFGAAVAAAGDVNGDGFADVAVGAPDYPSYALQLGRAELFLGSPSGVGDQPVWSVVGPTGPALMGHSVAGGDHNGDGFSDVVVGVPSSDSGAIDGGSVELFLGNAGEGRQVLARQFRGGDDPAPVQPWGLSRSEGDFQVMVTATSPRGRELAKLHVEACPPGIQFGHASCRHAVSDDWTEIPLGTDGVDLSETVSGLAEGELYRWRAHVLYAPLHADEPGITTPPVPRHGPWRRLFASAPAADIRTGMPPQQITITLADQSSSVSEAAPNAEIDVVVTTSDGAPTGLDCSVDFDTYNGTAIAGEDWIHASWNVLFPQGTENGAIQTIAVDLIDDGLDEPDETFILEIFNPMGAGVEGPTDHTVTILDDEPTPGITSSDLWVSEDVGVATVILELSGPSAYEVLVSYLTHDGSAIEGEDYVPVAGVAIFPPTTVQAEFDVPIIDDFLDEGDEIFSVELYNPVDAVLLTPEVLITITDNDLPGLPFDDGFESGDTSAWSATVP